MRVTVYISGPITLGDWEHNLKQSLDAQRTLIDAGFAPMNPMLTGLIPWANEVSHEAWIDVDLPWVHNADCVLRLDGESAGADEEVSWALTVGIPVFYSIADLIHHWNEMTEEEVKSCEF